MQTCPLLLLVFTTAVAYGALPLPPYMKPCALSDPDFQKCALKHGKEAIPYIVKGDRLYKIPNLDPVRIDEIVMSQGPRQAGFNLSLTNLTIYGVKDTQLTNIHLDPVKRNITSWLRIPRLEILGQYKISGQLLVLPIRGSGNSNITVENADIIYSYYYEVEDDRLVVKNYTVQVETTKTSIYMGNLFGGDKFLSDQMNTIMNDNWRDVFKEMSPAIAEALGQVASTIMNNVAEAVPYRQIFPETLPS